VPCIELSGLSEAQKRAYILADNRLALDAGWDDGLLRLELGELGNLGLPVEATVYGFLRKPTIPFHPPENPHLPMFMIGPGTGVAPFRGFLLERAALKKQGAPIGESLLFFGCRDPMQDFLYEDEMRALEAGGVTKLVCAFSREPGKPKTHVQQAITANGDAGTFCRKRCRFLYVARPRAWRPTSGKPSSTFSASAAAPHLPTARRGSRASSRAADIWRTSGRLRRRSARPLECRVP
jgi:hypothetical protein